MYECSCGNDSKVDVGTKEKPKYLCWSCYRRREGWSEDKIKALLPKDEVLNRKGFCEKKVKDIK